MHITYMGTLSPVFFLALRPFPTKFVSIFYQTGS